MSTDVIFNLSFALSQLSNNKDLLIKLLEKFAHDYANISDDLGKDIADGQYKSAKDKAHMLKGVAGNLGMQSLQSVCREIELPLLNRSCDEAQLNSFNIVFKETLAQVQLGLSELKQIPLESAGKAKLSPQTKLIKKLENYEFIPPEQLDELLHNIGNDNLDLKSLKKSIIDLEYDLALNLLNA